MTNPPVIGVLRELLAAEQKSIAPRLLESTVYVALRGLREFEAVRRAAQATREHERRLTELIIALGGAPGPRSADVRTGDLHFLEVHFIIPRLLADREALIRTYEAAAARLAREPNAAATVGEILERHRAELADLQRLSGSARRAG
jgi:hypothetical protein